MLIAFLENNLQADGTVKIPEVLWPYMGGTKVLDSEKEVTFLQARKLPGKSVILRFVFCVLNNTERIICLRRWSVKKSISGSFVAAKTAPSRFDL